LDKFVKIAAALRALLSDPFGFRRLGTRSRLVFVTSLYYYNFYKATVLLIKPFIGVEKEQTAPLFSIQTLHFLLVAAQKYYLSRAQGTLATRLIAVD